MNTVEILKQARALIADEKNWTQGAYARDADGEVNTPERSGVVCFCSVGAIHRAGEFDISCPLPKEIVLLLADDPALRQFAEIGFEGKIVEFNDTHSHADVLALFDRSIARAETVGV